MKTLLQFLIVLSCATALAQDANVIPFQGQLANQAGQSLTPNNPTTVVFRLYREAVGGVAIWEESQPNISVNAGRFSVLLGSRTELPANTNFSATLYLGLTVDDGNPATTDVEMRPRQALVPVISAAYAKEADKLGGYDWSVLFGSADPSTGSILDSKLRDASITGAKLQPQSVTSNHVQERQMQLRHLADELREFLVPVATILPFAGDQHQVPGGWALCDGREVPVEGTYNRLHQIIGGSWGKGNGSSTFNLPDLRGLFLRGVDNSPVTGQSGRDPNRANRIALGPLGHTGNLVGSLQLDEFSSHSHGITDPGHRHAIWGDIFNSTVGGGRLPSVNQQALENWIDTESAVTGIGINASGGNETRPKNAYVNYIIKY